MFISTNSNRPPSNLRLTIHGCFYPPIMETTITPLTTGTPPLTTGTPFASSTPLTTGTPSATSTSSRLTTELLPPTTITMNYCTEHKGMNQPLTIQPEQVTSIPPPEQPTTELNINPTSTTPGLNYSSSNPQINIKLDQPATLTVIYLPIDRPNQPSSNVNNFTVTFIYPDGTTSKTFPSKIESTSMTTTTPSGIPSETTTTPSTSAIIPPSDVSPRVDLPPNFQVPQKTTIVITIISTNDNSPPTGVCILSLFVYSSLVL